MVYIIATALITSQSVGGYLPSRSSEEEENSNLSIHFLSKIYKLSTLHTQIPSTATSLHRKEDWKALVVAGAAEWTNGSLSVLTTDHRYEEWAIYIEHLVRSTTEHRDQETRWKRASI